MTVQAGIQVADNVWDRLANMVQYPPDFDEYARREGPGGGGSSSGSDALADYTASMRAWDRAIGHQVIIKKRIVYKEAIERLQVRLEILRTERGVVGLESRRREGGKRKVGEVMREEGEGEEEEEVSDEDEG